MDCRNRIASYKRGNQRLLVKDFELKPIKKGGKILFWQFITPLNFKIMSLQMTNNYIITSTSSNPYITRKLNNMDKAKAFKEEWDN